MAIPLIDPQGDLLINRGEYDNLLKAIHSVYGYDFTNYAESSIRRRIVHFMTSHQINSLSHLSKIILHNENLFEEFVQELSVTVTQMFRDPSFYQCIRKDVIKRLATYPVIKIWIAGCATGEEVYSIAILLREEGLLDRSIIYATDINQKSLQIAKEGVFALSDMQAYTSNYLSAGGKTEFSKYYTAKFDSVLFDRSLIRNTIFSPHNLATDSSFNEFQFVICRNVLMYFNHTLQSRVVDLFYNSLCHFGFFGIGDKESLLFADRKDCFDETDCKEKIYRKIK